MSLGREFKTCFISLILLLSLLSVFVITPENVKAEPIGETTTLYFHDVPVEDVLDEDLLDLIMYFDLNEEKFQELLDKIEELEEKLFNESTPEDEIPEIEAELEELLEESFRLNLGYIIDQNPPSKTNDSEYPPTLNKIFNLFFKGDLKSIISNLLKGGNLSEETMMEFEELIEDILSSLASFRGFYVYNGDESVSLSGEVTFNLYFSSPITYIVDKDVANVSFYVLGLDQGGVLESKFTKSENVEIRRQLLSPFENPAIYEIPIMIATDLDPGDIIMVDIDIAAKEKQSLDYILDFIDDYIDFNISQWALNETLEEFAEILNSTGIELLVNLSEMLLNLSELLEEGGDFSDLDLTEFLEQMTSSFIYDSISHPSSLTLPFSISGEDNENIKRYYLHDENKMDEELSAEGASTQKVDLSKSSAKWVGPDLERSKILKEATASLYIDHQDLPRILNFLRGKIKVTAKLLDGDTSIATAEKELNKTGILDLLQKPDEPTIFTFSDIGHEVVYGNSLGLEVSISDGTKLGLFRKADLLYDSKECPSSLTVKFEETNHITIDVDPSDEVVKVALGGNVEFILGITSNSEDEDIDITKYGFSQDEDDKWKIEITPESFSISEGGQETVNITITSTDTDLDSYGDILDVTFAATGKTGKATFNAKVEISEDAVEYNIDVTADPQGQEIKHGESGTYLFKIRNNNTGLWPDSYTIDVSSEHDWDLNISYDEEDLAAGDEVKINVTVFVPEDTKGVSSDVLKFTVTSEGSGKSKTVNITTTVISPSILERLYGFFESAAESLGLDEIFGSYVAAVFLAAILFIIIFFILIILVYFLTRKFVDVVCLERIKEISSDEEAKFEITVQNPYKEKLSYKIYTEENSSSLGWDVSLDTEDIELESKQSKTVILTVKPTSFVKPNDWVEVKVVAKVLEKQKFAKLSTATTIKDAQPELRIYGVFHWPKAFKKGDRVMTSFKLENRGNASASNVSVVLYVNDKKKNKVEDITIPSGGYADIEMPWIAVKGKNEVNIVVK
jgi:hypothetical protein